MPVSIKLKGEQDASDFAFLVVGCNPNRLELDRRPEEDAIFSRLKEFTFHTALWRVKANEEQLHGVVFSPTDLSKMDGSFYAFRNETAKSRGLKEANKELLEGKTNLVTTYQISQQENMQAPFFTDKFNPSAPTPGWWKYSEFEPVMDEHDQPVQLTTPYFAHFDNEGLRDELPWKLLEMQGENQTAYVHAFTCFESALHCWQYINMLFDEDRLQLPEKDAPIAIVGAGVSGLLAARKLNQLGYKNLTIFEKSNRFGGKTRTEHKYDNTVCELGTCYLSPAYDKMVNELVRDGYVSKHDRFDFAMEGGVRNPNFRAVATHGQFSKYSPGVDETLPFRRYVFEKAKDYWLDKKKLGEAGWIGQGLAFTSALDVFNDIDDYGPRHRERMGTTRPMPLTPPKDVLEKDKTFVDYLDRAGMRSFEGALQYAYSVQGYGVLGGIPAYYAALWVTPETTDPILSKPKDPLVTAWREGWLPIWEKLIEKEGLESKIRYGADIESIQRTAS